MTPATNPPIRFGTDGWRAIIAEEFTFANVRVCAQAYADHLNASGAAGRGAVVGYDTRFGSDRFARAVATVLAANGVHVWLCDRAAPTPAVSLAVTRLKAAGGAVITASHNPGDWNGFKYKPEYAGSASPKVVAQLEQHIAQAQGQDAVETLGLEIAKAQGLLVDFNPEVAYQKHLAGSVDIAIIQKAGLRIAVDSMYGSGAGYLAKLVGGGRTSVADLRAEANPNFPGLAQPEPIAPNLGPTAQAVRERGFDVALATDGDADRLGILDESGEFITTLQTFSLLCLHQLEVRGQRGALVKSLTQSGMIDKLGRLYRVPVHTTEVGFKYLGPVLVREDALAAGEESGGYAFRGHTPERDGILSGLLFLELMVRTGKRPSELVEWLYQMVGPHHYNRWDVQLDSGVQPPSKERLISHAPQRLGGLRVEGTDATDGVRFLLQDGFWGLVRASGTEPLVRLYAEAESPERVQEILTDLRSLAGL